MSSLFTKAKDAFLRAQINWEKDAFRVCLASNVPDVKKDEFLSDIAVVAVSAPLAGKKIKDGVAKAESTVIAGIPDRERIQTFVLFQDTGEKGSSRLVALIDDFTRDSPLISQDGRDIQIVWGTGNAIFEL